MFKKKITLQIEAGEDKVLIPFSQLPKNFTRFAGEKVAIVTGKKEWCKIEELNQDGLLVDVPNDATKLYVLYDYIEDFDVTPVVDAIKNIPEPIDGTDDIVEAIERIEIPPFDPQPILKKLDELKNLPKKDYTKGIENIQKEIKNIKFPTLPMENGRILVTVDRVGETIVKGGGGNSRVKLLSATNVVLNPATEEKQDAIITAIGNQTPPAGGATEAKQDSSIALETTLNSLVETLQELASRLQVLTGMANAGAPALRTIPIASVSTAVSGPITSAQSIAEKNLGGVSYPQRLAQENLTAIQANINNVTA